MTRDAIARLLRLQERDRRILQVREALARIGPERQHLQARSAGAQAASESARHQAKHIESERKRLELEVDAKKQLIERYALQQFETRKNDEYRALAHEIEMCKGAITKIEDQELDLMEQADQVAKEMAAAGKAAQEATRVVDDQIASINEREERLQAELRELEANRDELAAAVDERIRLRYDRLFKNKGETVVVGIQHGCCGGCHMRLPAQIVVSCQGQQEIQSCPNCGRILYFSSGMDLAVAE